MAERRVCRFRHGREISKDPSGEPAIAAKWLLTVRGLIGELVDSTTDTSTYLILLAMTLPFVAKATLNREGYQVLDASDATRALAARRIGGNFDLLITDLEWTGWTCLEQGNSGSVFQYPSDLHFWLHTRS